MDNFEFKQHDYYNREEPKTLDHKINYFAKLFMKMGLGKTRDQANLWVILVSVMLFGISFVTLLG